MVLPPYDDPPRELCLIRLSAIGDTCHTVPVVRAIQDAWPLTRITWIIGKTEHGLLNGLDGVEFIVFDKSRKRRAYFDVGHALAGRRFDILLHMHASMRANLVSLAVRRKTSLGFDRARARDYQWLFCRNRLPATPQQHVMDGLFEFAEAIGVARGDVRWDLPLDAGDREFAARIIGERDNALVISPCTGQRFRNFRNWSVERYAQIADYAAARFGARVVLTGGPTGLEQEYGREITARSTADVLNLIGTTTLKQLVAILERASVVLCPDSGPAHMATAVGTPVVGLYATSNRFRTGPYFSQDLVVDKYPEAVRDELGKSVDEVRWGRRVRNPDTMNRITVDDVKPRLHAAFERAGVAEIRGSDTC
ncbi:MAG TPA: glycosyltransferase family 9 protein [Gammaproteobacteria bacterium]